MSKLLGALVRGRLDQMGEIVAKLSAIEPLPEGAAAFVIAHAIVQEILNYVGQHDLAEQYSERLERVGQPLTADPTMRGWIEYARGDRARRDADVGGAITLMRHAEASFEEGGSTAFVAMTRARLGFLYTAAGAHDAAEGVLRGVATTGDHGFQTTLAAIYLALALAERGAFEGGAALDEADGVLAGVAAAQAARRNLATLGLVRWISAVVARRRGDLDGAHESAIAARELLAASPMEQICATATLADVLLAKGRVPEAIALVNRAAEARRAFRRPHILDPWLWLAHVDALDAAGQHEAAATARAAAQRELRNRAAAIVDPDLGRSFGTRVPAHARIFGTLT